MPFVLVPNTVNPLGHFSLKVTLESANDGQQFLIGTLPFEISNLFDLFRYNGGNAGFLFPADPTFWGQNPMTDTFRLVFQNTGDPFPLLFDPSLGVLAPTDAVESNLDSSETSPTGFRVAQRTSSVTFSQISEPRGLTLIGSLVLFALGFKKNRNRSSN